MDNTIPTFEASCGSGWLHGGETEKREVHFYRAVATIKNNHVILGGV